jgi:hypothetical protein
MTAAIPFTKSYSGNDVACHAPGARSVGARRILVGDAVVARFIVAGIHTRTVARPLARGVTGLAARGIAGGATRTRAVRVACALLTEHGAVPLPRHCGVERIDRQLVQIESELAHNVSKNGRGRCRSHVRVPTRTWLDIGFAA